MKIIIDGQFSYTRYPLTHKVKRSEEIATQDGIKVVEIEVDELLPNIVDVDETLLGEIGKTKCFDVTTGSVIDYVPPMPSQEEQNRLNEDAYHREVKRLLMERGYDSDRVQAIVCNSIIENDAKVEEHKRELIELQKVRRECKDIAYYSIYHEAR